MALHTLGRYSTTKLIPKATLKELMQASPKRWKRLTHSKQKLSLSKNGEIICPGKRSMTYTVRGVTEKQRGFETCSSLLSVAGMT